ncbi:MAG TPA: hypothetical protein VJ826_15275 [Candidatus Polarisedimenticolaceae bacterium]|nr:hypothetical protein [Candidatus Polarisedimenticolaceae bacterium]
MESGPGIDERVQEARRAAERAVRRGIEKLEDIKDEGVHYVKRNPVKAVAMAAGAGLIVGLVGGWIVRRRMS